MATKAAAKDNKKLPTKHLKPNRGILKSFKILENPRVQSARNPTLMTDDTPNYVKIELMTEIKFCENYSDESRSRFVINLFTFYDYNQERLLRMFFCYGHSITQITQCLLKRLYLK